MKSKLLKNLGHIFSTKIPFLANHWPLVVAFFLFTLLLAKNPFSDRTLIPNFEPFPDTFYYVKPPLCWLEKEGWRLCRAGMEGIQSQVAPLYSIALLPFFLIKNDPRMFYAGNALFALAGSIIFYLIIQKIFKKNWREQFLSFFILFLYVTAYHFYWYPTLAMADNFVIFLFIIGLYLLTLPVSFFTMPLAVIFAFSFVNAKNSAVLLTPAYLIIYFGKIISKYKNNKKLLTKVIFLLSMGLILFCILTNFSLIKYLFQVSYKLLFLNDETDWFAFAHFSKNFDFYFKTLLGDTTKVLWDYRPFYPVWVGIGAVIGLIWALFKKQGLAVATLLLLFVQIIFMSFFYDHDGRYVFIILPAAFLGFAYFLKFSQNLFGGIYANRAILNGKNIFLFFMSGVFLIFNLNNFTRIKSQISLNLKYAEKPWYHLSVLEFNRFFNEPNFIQNSRPKPILISAVAPFLIDFYANGNYSLLPLSSIQEFRNQKEAVWGKDDYSNLLNLYKQKIKAGYQVFVTNYGIGNDSDFIGAFANIKTSFTLEKVQTGCYDQCNIYKLNLP